MSIYHEAECTCFRVWQSVTAPPPCPAHRNSYSWVTDWRPPCRGRHCDHDAACGRLTYSLKWKTAVTCG